jgi:hypothetical protein
MSQDKHNTTRQPLGCLVLLTRTYQPNHIEERIFFLSDRSQNHTPFASFEEYLGVHPAYPYKADIEVLAYYPDQHPADISNHYGHHQTTGVTLFPYPYDTNPEGPTQP